MDIVLTGFTSIVDFKKGTTYFLSFNDDKIIIPVSQKTIETLMSEMDELNPSEEHVEEGITADEDITGMDEDGVDQV